MIWIANQQLRIQVSQKGAALNALWCPGRDGNWANVLLGYETDEQRRAGECYAGEVVGPIANRLAGGTAHRDGVSVSLPANDRGNSLHGGPFGCSTYNWEVVEQAETSVALACLWTGENYPGPIQLSARYTLNDSALTIELTAHSEADTMLALAPHPYFNLGGETIDDHRLRIAATQCLAVDETGITDADSPRTLPPELDFRQAVALSGPVDNSFINVAGLTLVSPQSGRRLHVTTNQDAIQVYTGDFLTGAFRPRQGVAIEPQAWPNAGNRADFPSILLPVGETYRNVSHWQFDTLAGQP